jgi:hypothetical protein
MCTIFSGSEGQGLFFWRVFFISSTYFALLLSQLEFQAAFGVILMF